MKKKTILGLCFALLSYVGWSQGLENVTVEKYYISNAVDEASADAAAIDAGQAPGVLPVGSVTYRVYADMLPGYKLQAVYGNPSPTHTLKIQTTTSFYNNPSGGVTQPSVSKAGIKNNVAALDSWLSVGGACNSNYGILKSEDPGGTGANTINVTVASNPDGVLLNNHPDMGIPLTTQDGLYAAAGVQSVTMVGFTTETDIFGDGFVVGNSLITSDAAYSALSGAPGPIAATNRVLIGQFTTNGDFSFELNIQIGTPSGGSENYVANNPVGSEMTLPSLTYPVSANTPPTVTIDTPLDGANFTTGDVVAIAATATDVAPGTVTQVEFFVDGTSLSVDNSSPYTASYTSVAGTHTIVARATDNEGAQGSDTITINVQNDPAPTVTIDSPLNGAGFVTGDVVAIAATATDAAPGTITGVEFFVDGTSLSVDNSSPYTASYTAVVGTHTIVARATDNGGAQASDTITINVQNDPAPTVTIDSPLNGASFITGDVVAIAATATDAAPGTIIGVEFFVDGISLSIDNSSPYTASYPSTAGTHVIVAKATDNGGNFGSDTITINVQNDPAPTVTIDSPLNGAGFVTGDVVAISATATDAAPGTVTQVEFFVDGVSLSIDNSSPYTASYPSTAGTHIIVAKATDNGGNMGSDTVMINVQNDPAPIVTIDSPLNGASFITGDVVAIAATATDAAPGTITGVEFFVDGVSLSVDNNSPYTASYTSVAGMHTIVARATDNGGAQASDTITINVLNGNTKYTIGTVSDTCPATGFCLPVTALVAVSDVIGYEMIIQYDKLKVAPTGTITVSNSLVNPSFVETAKVIDAVNGRITVLAYLNASAPVSTRFTGLGDVLSVGFNTLPAFAAVDTALFSMISLKENYLTTVTPVATGSGKFFTYKDSIFHSGLRFWSDNQPIKYDVLNPGTYLITNIYGNNASCNALSAMAVQPNLSGNFDYTINNGTSVSIRRDIAPTTSVISVINDMDATLVRDIVLGIYPAPSVYQMIASDVNRDAEVNTNDITQIYWRSVLGISEFVQKTSPVLDWVFLDSSVTLALPAYQISATYPADNGVGYSKLRVPVAPFCLPVPTDSLNACSGFSSEIYKGVLIGDFDGSYAAIAPDGQIKKTVAADPNAKVIFDMSKAVVSGNFMDVPVSFSTTDDIRALNGELKFNEAALSYHSIIKNINDTDMEFRAHYHLDDKTLRFGANTLSKLNANTAVVSIRFNVLSGNVLTADLNPLSAFLNGVPSKIEVTPFTPTAIDDINNYQMVNVYPNPASNVLNIELSQNAIVEIMDATGKQVVVKTSVNANEKQEINVQDLANGIYMMKVSNDKFVSMQKVVINK